MARDDPGEHVAQVTWDEADAAVCDGQKLNDVLDLCTPARTRRTS
jgi:hypothetical protein